MSVLNVERKVFFTIVILSVVFFSSSHPNVSILQSFGGTWKHFIGSVFFSRSDTMFFFSDVVVSLLSLGQMFHEWSQSSHSIFTDSTTHH